MNSRQTDRQTGGGVEDYDDPSYCDLENIIDGIFWGAPLLHTDRLVHGRRQQ